MKCQMTSTWYEQLCDIYAVVSPLPMTPLGLTTTALGQKKIWQNFIPPEQTLGSQCCIKFGFRHTWEISYKKCIEMLWWNCRNVLVSKCWFAGGASLYWLWSELMILVIIINLRNTCGRLEHDFVVNNGASCKCWANWLVLCCLCFSIECVVVPKHKQWLWAIACFLHQKAYINHTTGQFVFKTVALEKNTGLTKDNLDRYVEILHKTVFWSKKTNFLCLMQDRKIETFLINNRKHPNGQNTFFFSHVLHMRSKKCKADDSGCEHPCISQSGPTCILPR